MVVSGVKNVRCWITASRGAFTENQQIGNQLENGRLMLLLLIIPPPLCCTSLRNNWRCWTPCLVSHRLLLFYSSGLVTLPINLVMAISPSFNFETGVICFDCRFGCIRPCDWEFGLIWFWDLHSVYIANGSWSQGCHFWLSDSNLGYLFILCTIFARSYLQPIICSQLNSAVKYNSKFTVDSCIFQDLASGKMTSSGDLLATFLQMDNYPKTRPPGVPSSWFLLALFFIPINIVIHYYDIID